MANFTDIILNRNSYELEISSGDFVIENSDQQSANLIINLFQGNLKQFPLAGVGLINYLASSASQERISQVIKQQLETDGFNVETLTVTPNGKIDLTASR